jgi:uncharacterized damage-inducible protein DinB
MSALEPILMEIDQEAAITKRVLERIPEEQLTWKPHEKSMSLGQLAMHIAQTPGGIAAMLAGDSHQINPAAFENMPGASSRQEILDAFSSSVAKAREFVAGLDDERASATWSLMAGPQVLMAAPRSVMIRTIMLNHLYHHRGQLTVYLRLLNVSVPVVYGRSADESAFGPPAQKASA